MTTKITIRYPQPPARPRRAAIERPSTVPAAVRPAGAAHTVTVAGSAPTHAYVGREDLSHPGRLSREDPG